METTRRLPLQPRKALRALRALLADPDDLPQVFTIIEALSGDTAPRMVRRLARTDAGRRLLADQPDIVPLLEDRAALRSLPEGTLGRAYLAFVESEGISAAGIRAASEAAHLAEGDEPSEILFFHRRMRDTHDLWHALTGYHGDVLGEAALLGFILAQTWNPGVGVIVAAGLVKTSGNPVARALILDGFRRGREAAWLPEQPWETLLSLPVAEVRRLLRVEAPAVYTPVRSADLRAAA